MTLMFLIILNENVDEWLTWNMEQNKKKHLASIFTLEKLRETADVVKR
jgi:hypothetical protein